jgi:EmrB/QacA subfamily drug resistance transporter
VTPTSTSFRNRAARSRAHQVTTQERAVVLGPRPPRAVCGPRSARTPGGAGGDPAAADRNLAAPNRSPAAPDRSPAAPEWSPAAPDRSPAAQSRSGYSRAALILILAAAFMVVLDFSIVNVALPSIQRELGFPAAAAQWVVTGYAITFGGLLILGGRAADLFGRRRMFVAGLIAFSVASLAGGLAQDPVLLVAARAVQGAGAALVAPAALSLITTGFPEGPQRTRALGLYGATASVGFVAGQVLGGVLVEFTSWRAVFLVNVPVGLAAVLLAPRLLGRGREQRTRRRLDVGGAVLITVAVASIVFAVSEGGAAGWTSPWVLGAAAAAALALAGFALAERRHPDPLVRGDLLRLRSLRKSGALIVLLGIWNGGEMLVLSLYFQQVLHDSPLVTGLAIAPQGMVGFAAGAAGARLASRLGLQRLLVLTNAVAMLGFLVLTQLPATGGYSPLLAAVTFVGFGTAGTAFGSMVTATKGVADGDQGFVGGVINTGRQIGAGIGAALLPAIALSVSHGGHTAGVGGDRAAMLAGAVAAGLATLIAATLRSRPAARHTPVTA